MCMLPGWLPIRISPLLDVGRVRTTHP